MYQFCNVCVCQLIVDTQLIYICQFYSLNAIFYLLSSNVLWYLDWIYYKTAHGEEFAAKCNYVHSIAESIITQRKKTLVKTTTVIFFRNYFLIVNVCLNEFNVRQHYEAIQTIGHSLRSTPRNELGFTAPSLPLRSTHPSTNRGQRPLTSMNEPLSLFWSPP